MYHEIFVQLCIRWIILIYYSFWIYLSTFSTRGMVELCHVALGCLQLVVQAYLCTMGTYIGPIEERKGQQGPFFYLWLVWVRDSNLGFPNPTRGPCFLTYCFWAMMQLEEFCQQISISYFFQKAVIIFLIFCSNGNFEKQLCCWEHWEIMFLCFPAYSNFN